MATKAINTLRVKNAAQMAADDYILGHDAGNPTAFRGRLDELAKLLAAQAIDVGTFTPTLLASTGNPTVTYGTRYGNWVRQGSVVTFDLYLQTTVRTGGSGNLRVGGLPFTFPRTIPLPVRPNQLTYPAAVIARGISGSAVITLDMVGTASGPTEMPIANWPNNAAVHITGSIIAP